MRVSFVTEKIDVSESLVLCSSRVLSFIYALNYTSPIKTLHYITFSTLIYTILL